MMPKVRVEYVDASMHTVTSWFVARVSSKTVKAHVVFAVRQLRAIQRCFDQGQRMSAAER